MFDGPVEEKQGQGRGRGIPYDFSNLSGNELEAIVVGFHDFHDFCPHNGLSQHHIDSMFARY